MEVSKAMFRLNLAVLPSCGADTCLAMLTKRNILDYLQVIGYKLLLTDQANFEAYLKDIRERQYTYQSAYDTVLYIDKQGDIFSVKEPIQLLNAAFRYGLSEAKLRHCQVIGREASTRVDVCIYVPINMRASTLHHANIRLLCHLSNCEAIFDDIIKCLITNAKIYIYNLVKYVNFTTTRKLYQCFTQDLLLDLNQGNKTAVNHAEWLKENCGHMSKAVTTLFQTKYDKVFMKHLVKSSGNKKLFSCTQYCLLLNQYLFGNNRYTIYEIINSLTFFDVTNNNDKDINKKAMSYWTVSPVPSDLHGCDCFDDILTCPFASMIQTFDKFMEFLTRGEYVLLQNVITDFVKLICELNINTFHLAKCHNRLQKCIYDSQVIKERNQKLNIFSLNVGDHSELPEKVTSVIQGCESSERNRISTFIAQLQKDCNAPFINLQSRLRADSSLDTYIVALATRLYTTGNYSLIGIFNGYCSHQIVKTLILFSFLFHCRHEHRELMVYKTEQITTPTDLFFICS